MVLGLVVLLLCSALSSGLRSSECLVRPTCVCVCFAPQTQKCCACDEGNAAEWALNPLFPQKSAQFCLMFSEESILHFQFSIQTYFVSLRLISPLIRLGLELLIDLMKSNIRISLFPMFDLHFCFSFE